MSNFLVPLSLPRLEAALVDAQRGGPEARWVSALALGSYTLEHDERVLAALARLSTDSLEEVRAQAIEGLHGHALAGVAIDIELLRTAMHDDAPRVRCAAVEALAAQVENDDEICVALRDPNPDVRASAAAALCGTLSPEALEALATMLDDQSPIAQFEAARGLAIAQDSRGLQVLIEAVSKGDEQEEFAIEALGLLGDHRAQDCLRTKAGRLLGNRRGKALAAAALVRCRDDSGREQLASQLRARSHKTRMAAIAALCTLPISGLSQELGDIVDRRDDEEASSALLALTAIANQIADVEARRELVARRGHVRQSLSEELEDALSYLKES